MQPPSGIVKRWMRYFVLLTFFATTGLSANTNWKSLSIFNSPADDWKASDDTAVHIKPSLYGRHAGLQADLQMRPDQERIYFDRQLALNLSSITEFALTIRVDNPAAVSRVSLYFKSGAGWYGGWFKVSGSDWQTISLPRSDFGAEGAPTGWSSIDGIRLAFWKAQPQQSRIDVAAVRGRSSPISILRNAAAAETKPGEIGFINRSTKRLSNWFSRYGLHTAIIDDQSLPPTGIPAGCRLLILPCNPVITPAVENALLAFTQRGGKLIVIYGLPDELVPILGLSSKRWLNAEPPDLLSTIQLDTGAISGAPNTIRQDSWNANIPKPERARIIGTWQRGNGQDSGLPAITLDSNGAFIGHVLTNIDRDNKMQLLLALSATLVPELSPMLGQQLWLEAQQLFAFENWAQTRDYIEKTAIRNRRSQRVRDALTMVERLRKTHHASASENGTFGTAIEQASEVRDQIRQAYFRAIAPPAGGSKTEFRGVWCHDASGPSGHNWNTAASALKQAGFNTLLANHLWAGVAYYPSDVLPTATTVASQGDLLQKCLDACQREGISMHLWSVLWVLQNAPDDFVEQMKEAGRLVKNSSGETRKWLCPANPLNVQLAAKAAAEAVARYNVDGVHLDYIRYPDHDACFCQHCAKRFRHDTGRAVTNWPQAVLTGPDHEAFLAWRRDRITEALTRISQAVKTARPTVQVSAAVWGNWPGIRDTIGQDWVRWCRDGTLDFVTPMNYVNTAAEARELYQRQRLALPSGFALYPGIAPTTYNLPPEQTVRQVDTLRRAGAQGFVLFELDPDLLDSHLPALRVGATSR